MNTKVYQVINGPSRDRLVEAFKYAYDEKTEVPVDFGVVFRQVSERSFVLLKTKDFRILSLQHEDGSGQSFNIEGYCQVSFLDPTKYAHLVLASRRFKAYYNTATRKGTIKFDIS